MSVKAELLEDILAAPADDGPRLVYADHLMEEGDPRGEFIRVQCLQKSAPSPALAARQRELWAKHSAQFFEEDLGRPGMWEGVYERGFMTRLKLGDAPAELVLRTPFVTGLEVKGDATVVGLANLMAAGKLRQLAWLEVEDVTAASMALLGEQPALPRLLFMMGAIGAAGALAAGSCSSNLVSLSLKSPLGDEDVVQVAALRHLESLTMRHVAAISTKPLLESEDLASLTELDSDELDADALLESPHLRRLQKLVVYDTDVPVGHLARCGKLTALKLFEGTFTEDDVRQLVGYGLPLKQLALPRHGLTPQALRLLGGLELARLDVDSNHLSGGMDAFDHPNASSLTTLLLRWCRLKPEDARLLAANPTLSNLQTLDLRDNFLDEESKRLVSDRFGSALQLEED
jgi:uncharacterized protein (TIGR02996 family)